MRDRREPARMADDEDPPRGTAGSSRRFARLVASPATRRIATSRVGLTLLAAAVVLGLLLVAGSRGARALVGWLHDQPSYRIPFVEIALEPEPPAWFLGGSRAFLDEVRRNAKRPESLSVLDVVPAVLADDFRRYAWVKEVILVKRLPLNRLVVRLDYREPVARWEKDPTKIIDGDGVLLPSKDIAPETVDRLMWLWSVDQPPFDPHPGEVWKAVNAADDLPRADERVVAAARLASFLKSRQAGKALPSLRPERIHPIIEKRHLHMFVEFADQVIVYWGDPPGGEPLGQPTASEKWEMLQARVRPLGTLGVSNPRKDYLKFTKTKVVQDCCREEK